MSDRAEREIGRLRDLMERQGLLSPAPSEPTGTPDDDERLLARILADQRVVGTAPGRAGLGAGSTRQRHWSRPSWVAAAAAVAVLASVIGLNQLRSAPRAVAGTPVPLEYSLADPADVRTAPSAREALLGLADAAAAQPATRPSGTVQYVSTFGWDLEALDPSVTVAIVPTTTRSWLASDGSARFTQYRAEPLDVHGRFDPDLPRSPAGPVATDEVPAGTFDAAFTAVIPRDPAALEQVLLSQMVDVPCTEDTTWYATCLVTATTGLFDTYVVPPDLAAALWTVLADTPGFADLGTTIDRAGRPGHAIAVQPLASRRDEAVTVLVVSPTTGDLLATETVTLSSPELHVDEPTVTGFTTRTDVRWVAAVGSAR